VIRLWEVPTAELLHDPGLTPLAPLGAVKESELPDLAQQIQERWKGLAEPEVKELKTATETLMGLRFEMGLIQDLFGEVSAMEESVIYQEIYQRGKAEGLKQARQTLMNVGKKRLECRTPTSARKSNSVATWIDWVV
jgi:predicted transposase YdaD